MIEAKIICDSVAPSEVRLTTFVLTYPRFIHSELMTHRVFSRNASSSRAIPVKKQIQEVMDNPAIPLAFTKNQKGMQGGEVLDEKAHELAMKCWLHARDNAVNWATALSDLEVHKQYANRILEPYAHITVVLSSTEYDNWFGLRYHTDAQPEICQLAKQMWEVYSNGTPKRLRNGEWHIPFMDDAYNSSMELGQWFVLNEQNVCRSVAKCARTSYKNHDGTETTVTQDLNLYNKLVVSEPLHASPAEHQAMAVGDPNVRSGNFCGWVQYRKTLPNENIKKFEPKNNT